MKHNMNSAKISLIVSVFALIIALVNLIYSSFNGRSIMSAVTLFCAMLTIFFANIQNYKSYKNNNDNLHK